MNKKKLLIIIFSVIFSGLVFSETKDEEKFRSYIESSRGFNLSKKREENLTYLCSGKLSENSYFSSYVYNFRYQSRVETYLTDGKLIDEFYSHELNGIPNNKLKQQIRYLVETKATSLFADFDYDESLEILSYGLGHELVDYVIYEFFTYDERGFNQQILSHTSWEGYMPGLSRENRYRKLVRDFAYRVQSGSVPVTINLAETLNYQIYDTGTPGNAGNTVIIKTSKLKNGNKYNDTCIAEINFSNDGHDFVFGEAYE